MRLTYVNMQHYYVELQINLSPCEIIMLIWDLNFVAYQHNNVAC